MDKALHVFEPISFQNNMIMTISLIIIGLMLLFLFFNERKKVAYFEKKRKKLWSLLAFYAIIISFCTLIFGFMVSGKYNAVKFYESELGMPDGELLKYKSIKSSYLFFERQAKRINSEELVDSSRLLVIESYSGDNFIIPEKHYDVEAIIKFLHDKTDNR